MTDGTELGDDQTRAAESLLAAAWHEDVRIRKAELIWDRSHIVRLLLDNGRSAVLKRRRTENFAGRVRGFGAELAALKFLTPMPSAVAPRLLGADTGIGILVMEDLGRGGSLAHALLGTDQAAAVAAVTAYARALAELHSWSIGRSEEFAAIRARRAPEVATTPHWADFVGPGKVALLAAAAELGLGGDLVDRAAVEIDSLADLQADPRYTGLVHSDACPDNTHISGTVCRLIDFETSGWGPVALDAAYLLAPFPSCWCFSRLPTEVTATAMSAYQSAMSSSGVVLGASWDTALAAALASLVVARGESLASALNDDQSWGTTTIRPRVLTWLRAFTSFPQADSVLPRLHALAVSAEEVLTARWAPVHVPEYPALARPGALLATVPQAWDSD
jgi:Ser/Thr protein kinase RdoA (MazF antagonist)